MCLTGIKNACVGNGEYHFQDTASMMLFLVVQWRKSAPW